jgi:hypothetical protein
MVVSALGISPELLWRVNKLRERVFMQGPQTRR